jgi:hypothetical protein
MASSILVLPFALYHNPGVCDSAVMTSDAGKYITQQVFTILATMHKILAPAPSSFAGGDVLNMGKAVPSSRAMCVVASNTLTVAIGFLLPTIILAMREAADYSSFKVQHDGRGHAPTAFPFQVYTTFGSKDAIDRMRMFLIVMLLVHITWTCHLKMVSGF